ncbi:hypothetical protein [Catellatospora methionotrophica]|uniref:hypothetical protein n=1 Tax=Catellatospora methionotrophica TaxID=121620 RepID=UPI0033E295A6
MDTRHHHRLSRRIQLPRVLALLALSAAGFAALGMNATSAAPQTSSLHGSQSDCPNFACGQNHNQVLL